jgi:hypothetical protein
MNGQVQLPYNNHIPFSQQEITLPVDFSSKEARHNFMSCKLNELSFELLAIIQ